MAIVYHQHQNTIVRKKKRRLMIFLALASTLLMACQQRVLNRRVVQEFSEEFDNQEIEAPSIQLSAKNKPKNMLIAAASLKADSIYFYAAGRFTGKLGGRAGANQTCEKALESKPDGFKVLAFLTAGPVDRIDQFALTAGVPRNLPVKGLVSQQKIANNWYEIFSETTKKQPPQLLKSLHQAAVFIDGGNRLDRYEGFFWSGTSYLAGSQESASVIHNCENWTSEQGWGAIGGNHAAVHPTYQNSSEQAYTYPWYDYQMIMSCQQAQTLLCLIFPSKASG